MDGLFRQRLLKRLATISLAAGCGLIDPGPSLLEIPSQLMLDLVDENDDSAEGVAWRDQDRARLLDLLASDARPAVRARVAAAAASLWPSTPSDAERLVRTLVADPVSTVRSAAAIGFGLLLAAASPLARVDLVATWALSVIPEERAALARALVSAVPVLGADVVLGHFARDPSAAVRRWVPAAAYARLAPDGGARRERFATTLARDPVRRVRREARRWLGVA